MKAMKLTFITLLLLLLCHISNAQQLSQTIRGNITDKDSKMSLIGANIFIENTDQALGASTDIDGYFKIENVPLGRHNIHISYLGYEAILMRSILVTSGKELVLNIELEESTEKLEEVVVTAKHDKAKPLNEMALISARSFSVEETSRYAGSLYDPSRMAQNYAGVSIGGGTDDIFNEIIVRGNSPKGVLWRLEGIEIPNPNHFGSLGSSGGAISMLSSSTLSNSDFYTGAFPAEFGNAVSGVFDLNMRKGNNEKREYAFMLGALGVEAAIEGPFSKNSNASYLINYRYSTLALLKAVGLNPVGDILPEYSDLSFKFNLPTKNFGNFVLFGLGGENTSSFSPESDSTKWEEGFENFGFVEKQRMGVVGLSHRYILSETSYLRTVVSASQERFIGEEYNLIGAENYRKEIEEQYTYIVNNLRATTSYTNKLNAQNTLRLGAIFSQYDYSFDYQEIEEEGEPLIDILKNSGKSQLYQAYAQWKHKFNTQWSLSSGLHFTHFGLNSSSSLEPRVAVKWKFSNTQALSGAIGLHSKPEPIAFYFAEETSPDGQRTSPNKNLDLAKSLHIVLGYDHSFTPNLRFKAEAYFQHLYDVPVANSLTSTASIINASDIWDIFVAEKAVNDGTGKNYGIDLTIEKFFSNQYYFLVTGSLYDSKYTPKNGVAYNTRYNSNFQFNMLGGKEFKVGKKKQNIIGINAKIVLAGGNCYTPIDVEQSRIQQRTVRLYNKTNAERLGNYYRFDIGLSYKINKKRLTHSIMIDIQNVSNHQNPGGIYFNTEKGELREYYQSGLFPVFNYRIEF